MEYISLDSTAKLENVKAYFQWYQQNKKDPDQLQFTGFANIFFFLSVICSLTLALLSVIIYVEKKKVFI